MPRVSAGSSLTFCWSLASLFLVLSYVCNLRSALIKVDYEKKIETIRDILDKGGKTLCPRHVTSIDDMEFSPVREQRELYALYRKDNAEFKFNGELRKL